MKGGLCGDRDVGGLDQVLVASLASMNGDLGGDRDPVADLPQDLLTHASMNGDLRDLPGDRDTGSGVAQSVARRARLDEGRSP